MIVANINENSKKSLFNRILIDNLPFLMI